MEDGFQRSRQFLYGLQRETSANPGVCDDRRRKSDSIQSVVDAQPNTALNFDRIPKKLAQQRERQKSVSNRCAVRRLVVRALSLNVDPLSIIRDVGELPNLLLRNYNPFRCGELATEQVFQGMRCFESQRQSFSIERSRPHRFCLWDSPFPKF